MKATNPEKLQVKMSKLGLAGTKKEIKLLCASCPWSGLGQETTIFMKNNFLQALDTKKHGQTYLKEKTGTLKRKLFTVSAGHKSQYGMMYFNSKLRGSAAKEKGPQRKKPVLRLMHTGTESSSTSFFFITESIRN